MGVGIGAFMPGGALCGCMRCMTAANICGFMGMSDFLCRRWHFLEGFREADAFWLGRDHAFMRHLCGGSLRYPSRLGDSRVVLRSAEQLILFVGPRNGSLLRAKDADCHHGAARASRDFPCAILGGSSDFNGEGARNKRGCASHQRI